MEEIINSVMQSPENTNPNVLRGQLQKMGGSGGGSGVLMVTDTEGTLDKTMGEIQDAYFAGKLVLISYGDWAVSVIGLSPVKFGKGDYVGYIYSYAIGYISSTNVLVPSTYSAVGETEEAARNAYPVSIS